MQLNEAIGLHSLFPLFLHWKQNNYIKNTTRQTNSQTYQYLWVLKLVWSFKFVQKITWSVSRRTTKSEIFIKIWQKTRYLNFQYRTLAKINTSTIIIEMSAILLVTALRAMFRRVLRDLSSAESVWSSMSRVLTSCSRCWPVFLQLVN